MKQLINLYIALGLSITIFWGIDYTCTGSEMFPEFSANPFVFKKKSLASSMEYYYIVSGIIFNFITWFTIINLINYGFKKISTNYINFKLILLLYRTLVFLFFLNTSLHIFICYVETNGSLNHFELHWDHKQDSKNWQMDCKGKLFIISPE